MSPEGLLLVKTRDHAWFDLPISAEALAMAGRGGSLALEAEVMDESALSPRLYTRLASALDRYAELAATADLRAEFQEKLDRADQRAQGLQIEIERLKRALGPLFRPAQVLVVILRALKLLLTDRAGLRRALNQRGGGKVLAAKYWKRLSRTLMAPFTRRLSPYFSFLRLLTGVIRAHGLRGLRGHGLRQRWRDLKRGPAERAPMVRETRWWGDDYAGWAARMDARLAALPPEAAEPGRIISILVPIYNPPPEGLEAMVASVLAQKYAGWELCLADDCSPDPAVKPLLERLAAQDSRIKLIFRESNGHIAEATNSALSLATGDYVAFMDQDDLLHPAALQMCVRTLRAQPQLRLIYTDEDKLKDGVRCEPYFKPNWSPALLHSQYFVNHLTVVERALVQDAGGLRKDYSGAQDMDLFLRCLDRLKPAEIGHVPLILYHWRCTPGSIAGDSSAKPYAFEAGRNGLRDYFARRGQEVTVGESCHFSLHRVRFPVPPATRLALCLAPGGLSDQGAALAQAQTLLADWCKRVPNGAADAFLLLPADAWTAPPRG
ncbi:glycosyltransferase family 2 protein [Elstera litoralis]|uniref:glycosyltransferase family 2 protein n=1 Tax=Elstera litoralis TaxID=552518 RepID=UPI0006977B3B|nr:glycosyltransferase [Elstera litoralis]